MPLFWLFTLLTSKGYVGYGDDVSHVWVLYVKKEKSARHGKKQAISSIEWISLSNICYPY